MKPRITLVALIGTIIVLASLTSGTPVQAATKYEGQEEFRTYCNTCHDAGSPHGEYTPMTLIEDQWKRFFEKKYVSKHEGLVHPKMNDKPLLELVTPELLEKIRTFAIEHAADSEQPMTCG